MSGKRRSWNSSLSFDVDKARAWQRKRGGFKTKTQLERKSALNRGGRLNPFNRERRDRMRRDEHGHVVVYGPRFKWVAGLKTCILGRNPEHECIGGFTGHHLKSVGSGGTDADGLIDVCGLAHASIHSLGRRLFDKRWKVDLRSRARELAWLWDQLKPAAR